MKAKFIFTILMCLVCAYANAYAKTSPIFGAAETGNLQRISDLIQDGVNVNFKDADGNTALMFAAKSGKLEVVKLLVKHGASINAQNKRKFSALIFAADAGHFAIVRFLIEKGADPNACADDNVNATAYGYALKSGHNQIVGYLKPRTAYVQESAKNSGRRSGSFQIHSTSPQRKNNSVHWTASCDEGGSGGAYVTNAAPNVYCWNGTGFAGADGRCTPGIGVEAALRKACGGE